MNRLIAQASKFFIVGVLNTGIDFAVLNLLMFLTDTYKGQMLLLFNAIAFTTAVINSYFWNKFWTFKAKETTGATKMGGEFAQFLMVSIIGIAINSAIVYLVATFIPPQFGLSQELWANLAKVAATGASLVWNFIGYKFIVFKR